MDVICAKQRQGPEGTDRQRYFRERVEDDCFRVVEALTGEDSIRRDYFQSIKRFVELLGVMEVLDAAEIARAQKPWSLPGRFRYFCGVCWNKVRAADNA
jgi:hypothetical protein